ncbi:hypothetical protein FRC16_000816 [Serendipita sp. 398]|nr:hypothetical protein FRC16_000816 [Serendipita sp. 398]
MLATPHETVYEMILHPAFDASFFESPGDIALNQLPIYNVDDTMGALVLCQVILVAWVINNRTPLTPWSVMPSADKSCQGQYTPNFVPPSSEVVTKEVHPIVDRKRPVKPMNMRELEERILITISAANGRTATQKMDFIWSESQNISTIIP